MKSNPFAFIQNYHLPDKVFSKLFSYHFLIAFVLKSLLLLFFYKEIKNSGFFQYTGFFVSGGDTGTYYIPMENFIKNFSYGEPCRMPGLLPFYYPLRLLFNEAMSKNFMILFQIVFAAVSSVFLALISFRFTASKIVYFSALFLYSLNSFVGIWDLFGYADSFSVSFFIFSMYLLLRYFDAGKLNFAFLSGGFLTWSLFLRPIMIVPLLTAGMIIIIWTLALSPKPKHKWFKSVLFFFLPFLIFDGAWVIRNYSETKKIQMLAATNCFAQNTEQYNAVIKIPAALGIDFSFLRIGEWFYVENYGDAACPLKNEHFTKTFNMDSIVNLRKLYFESKKNKNDTALKQAVIYKVNDYLNEYKYEHPVDYYLYNPIKLFVKFLFPIHLDGLPFPALNNMNLFQKIIKSGYFLLLLITDFFALLFIIRLLFKPRLHAKKLLFIAIPLSVLGVLVFILGYIEQRYFCPVFPFFFIFAIISVHDIVNYLYAKYKW